MRLHTLDETLEAVYDTTDIDTHDPIPVFIGHLVHGATSVNSRVIAEDMDWTKFRFYLICNRSILFPVSDIQLNRHDFGVCAIERL